MKLFEASALTGQNVKEVFQALCKDLLSLVEGDSLPVLNNQKILRRQMKMRLPRRYAMKPTKDLLHELNQLGLETSSDLQDVMKYGSYRCFWCRIFLVGQFGVGKSTLAKVLVGDPLPDKRESTNGIWIYMGKAGMSIQDKEWFYMPQGNSKRDTISAMLLSLNYNNVNVPGYTKVDTEALGSSDDSRTNEALRIKQENDNLGNTEDKTTSQSRADSCQDRKPKSEYLISDPEVGDITKKLNMLIIDAIREGKFKQKIVPFDIWDFGGQKEFYLTHQLFITSRGVFVLMFNGSKDLRVNVKLMQEPLYKNTSEAAYLLVWVNSILTYCPKLVNGFPKIMLVATHKDKVSSKKQEVKRKQLISSLEQLFKDHSGMAHLEFRDLLFINTNDPADPDIAMLRQRLIQRAFEHPRWGEEMPTAWVPLEIQIAERVEKGVNIISKEELSEMNRNNLIMVLTDEQLEMFLKVQHSLGKLVYFDDVNLHSFIIINPVFLVDVLRSLVTEEQFWPQGPQYNSILRSVCDTGLIKEDDILLLWQQEQFKTFLPNKQYLLDMLTHLDVLVIPQPRKVQNQLFHFI